MGSPSGMDIQQHKLRLEELLRIELKDKLVFCDILRFVSVILKNADAIAEQDKIPAYMVLNKAFTNGFLDGTYVVDDTNNVIGWTWHYENRHTHCMLKFPDTVKADEKVCYDMFTRVVRLVEMVWIYVMFVKQYTDYQKEYMFISDVVDYEIVEDGLTKKYEL